MMFRNVSRVIVVLAVTAAMAQGTSPATVPGGAPIVSQRHGLAGRRGMSSLGGNTAGRMQTPVSVRQRVQDMETTVAQMHLVLKLMRDDAAKSHAKDPLVKGNLDMWELMVGHLDKQLQELKVAAAAREDLEARRAALYKQADAKAEAEAQAARAAQAAKFADEAPKPAPAGMGATQSPAGQTAPAQPSPTPQANSSPSPH